MLFLANLELLITRLFGLPATEYSGTQPPIKLTGSCSDHSPGQLHQVLPPADLPRPPRLNRPQTQVLGVRTGKALLRCRHNELSEFALHSESNLRCAVST